MSASFRILEDIALADTAFEATGDSLSELFEAAAQAVIDTMANPTTVGTTWRHSIERDDEDLATLLFDWLSEIVFLKDAEGVVFHDAKAYVITIVGRSGWHLRGTLTGAPVDRNHQELRADIKGVTKHLYELKQDGARWIVRVVLDL